jgi:hypothetical protein
MSTLVTEIQVVNGSGLSITEDALILDLADGRTISIPLAWYPRLLHGTADERNQ